MKIITDLENSLHDFLGGSVVTLGNFDGIHPGHTALIQKAIKIARVKKIPSVVVTYFPNPSLIVGKPKVFPGYLLELEDRNHLIASYSPDYLLILEFTKEFSCITAFDFLKNILIGRLNAKHIVLGYDHHFGRNRKGNFEFLQKHSHIFGYGVEKIEAIYYGEEKISSSAIRKYILEGNVSEANLLLGRNFFLKGSVIKGFQRGRQIGYPTANIQVANDVIIPATGVYAAMAKVEQSFYKAMVNIGHNPTFQNQALSIEGNLFDFEEDIYDKVIEYHFIKRIRDEIKFSSVNELVGQLREDEITVKNFKIL
ncbi:MAG: bifunctional riboflavin kinase/FAD synthetase [Leptospiraceae bacterium]|nr:bifunctional riboflavin kinase/FAD synthetase [Leptospiraceae bacterium]MCP5497496.1 bifunctional riboflavin kinase/FAD synthetase [Leptospiraceae bacterium]